ncbi:hypothetical protein KR018_000263 [Drosophila ironensis]|nr:hypothetical protein KR018_000263 [Drosophila ironensis]
MAAAVSQSFGLQEEVFVSRATIQLQMPPRARIYEWHTQVVGAPASTPTTTSPETECVRERAPGATETATPKGNYYTPPRILGTEAKAKNLPQTLGNFFEAERYASAWNRVTE